MFKIIIVFLNYKSLNVINMEFLAQCFILGFTKRFLVDLKNVLFLLNYSCNYLFVFISRNYFCK